MSDIKKTWPHLWQPPELLPLDEWAEKNMFLSAEYSPRTGPIKLYGWQRGIFQSFTDEHTEEIVLMVSTQLVKSIFIQAAIGYVVDCAPGPILMLLPKDKDASEFSTKRLGPMFRDCKILQNKIIETTKSKGQGKNKASNTILSKTFPNGSISLVGALVPGNMASRTIQYLFCDEVDKYVEDVGDEGSPIALARKRTMKFPTRRKIIQTCSPTIEHSSNILRAYEQTDMRQAWVPCHACGQFQVLDFWSGVKFDKFDSTNTKLTEAERAKSARYECIHCKAKWNDHQRWNACDKTEWRAQRPFAGKAGFHINHLYSSDRTLKDIVSEYLSTRNKRSEYKTFINTTLAQPWVEQGVTPDEDLLFKRRENYAFGEDAIVPQRALFLTCGVDVQESPPRLEVEVRAWGRDRESWSIDYQIIQAYANDSAHTPLPVNSPEVWAELDRRILQRNYKHASGHTLAIWAMGIDTGMNPQPIYNFALSHPQPSYNMATGGVTILSQRTVVPLKGASDENKIIHNVSNESAARKRQGVKIVLIGTQCTKSELFDNLRHAKIKDDQPTSNYIHFPMYEKQYFLSLCSERRVVNDKGVATWVKRFERNEALDLAVYNRALAALCCDRFKEHHWLALEESLKPIIKDQEPIIPTYQPIRRVSRGFN